MSFLQRLFGGRRNEPEKPEEEYRTLTGTLDGYAFAAVVNIGYRDFEKKPDFTWFLSILIPLVDPDDDGLNNEADGDELIRLENWIGMALRDTCPLHFIGRVTCNKRRELLFYVNAPRAASDRLQEMADSGKYRPFTFRCEQDPGWESIKVYLA